MALIVVQAGHYPRKSGATGTGGLDGDPTEQEFTIAAGHACVWKLRDAGHTCNLIFADVPTDDYRGDAFVAIHCDGSTSRAARGASVGYRTDEGRDFAARFKRQYQAAGWSGGWRPDNYTAALAGYYGTRHAVSVGNRRAFIAEAGFLTNPSDEALLSLPHGPERFARAVTAAVVELFGGRSEEDDMTEDQLIASLTKGKLRPVFKGLIQGSGLDALREPVEGVKDRGAWRAEMKELIREVLDEDAVPSVPPAG